MLGNSINKYDDKGLFWNYNIYIMNIKIQTKSALAMNLLHFKEILV